MEKLILGPEFANGPNWPRTVFGDVYITERRTNGQEREVKVGGHYVACYRSTSFYDHGDLHVGDVEVAGDVTWAKIFDGAAHMWHRVGPMLFRITGDYGGKYLLVPAGPRGECSVYMLNGTSFQRPHEAWKRLLQEAFALHHRTHHPRKGTPDFIWDPDEDGSNAP